MQVSRLNPGIAAALVAAVLFGASAPFAKLLLGAMSPSLLAALLYLGSGIGLLLIRLAARKASARLSASDWRWFAGAILCGGVAAPILLLLGLTHMSAPSASLLLNAEALFTALLAWFAFKENFDRRVAIGMLAIVAGALVLSWPASDGMVAFELSAWWPALAILGACFLWGLDNNLTRKVSLSDASWLTMVKGLVAGSTNLVIAMLVDSAWPLASHAVSAALLGFFAYGVSLMLFVLALRYLGTARTGAYFGVSSFFGALLAVVAFGEPLTGQTLLGGAFMLLGVVLHLSERHSHEHVHEELHHEHEHTHGSDDLHHAHEHDPPVAQGTRHSHWHSHLALRHAHEHYPDAHHTHKH